MFDYTTQIIQEFFRSRGLTQIDTQSKRSILAACEDPRTIATYNYAGEVWPLPQTGQMHLEEALLQNPSELGFYCMSTSYRQEPHPIEGRHDLMFPMAEFELPGDITVLEQFERDLLMFLKFYDLGDLVRGNYPRGDYDDVASDFGVAEIGADEEALIQDVFGDVFFLRNFPNSTSPFWNMKNNGTHASKIDVIIKGVETIGSAERSTNPDEMRHLFKTISGGMYCDILFALFTERRVMAELDTFLAHDFFPRCGGGIGITRMMKALS